MNEWKAHFIYKSIKMNCAEWRKGPPDVKESYIAQLRTSHSQTISRIEYVKTDSEFEFWIKTTGSSFAPMTQNGKKEGHQGEWKWRFENACGLVSIFYPTS